MALTDSQQEPLKPCLLKYELDYFQMQVLYVSGLRIFTAGKHIGIIRIKHFYP